MTTVDDHYAAAIDRMADIHDLAIALHRVAGDRCPIQVLEALADLVWRQREAWQDNPDRDQVQARRCEVLGDLHEDMMRLHERYSSAWDAAGDDDGEGDEDT